MAYKYSVGKRELGDIEFEGDPAETQIDFEDDFIALKSGGNQILIVSGSVVGIGTAIPDPNELLTIDGASGNHEANIQFREDGANRAKIGINNSDNLVFHNQSVNKHIVFKVNDQGVTREGLRLDGAVPEVVVNQQHGVNGDNSLIDFRVESDNNEHMLYVSGGVDRVGISTGTPHSGLHIDSSVAFAARAITQNHTITAADHTIFTNATSTNITITLPSAANIPGRQYVIKRVDTAGTSVTIATDGSETIEGAASMALTDHRSVVVQSDNSNWWIMAEYISPP